MNDLSENSMFLLGDISRLGDGPQRLYGAWRAGEVTDADLPGLIPQIWTRNHSPEHTIGKDAWLSMFRTAGRLVVPTNLPPLSDPAVVFRGAAERWCRGMAWTWDIVTARQHRDLSARFYEAAYVYRATVGQAAVLALFDTMQEHEVVVDPAMLGHVDQIE